MRCLLCERLSLLHICKECQDRYLKPSLYKRVLQDSTFVYSFYKYDEIKDLLHTKHTDLGFYIFSILAKNSFALFAKNFTYEHKTYSIAIDDNIKSGYSHTAILNRELKSSFITPLFNKLRAKNSINYSGKTKEFRLLNPRDFQLKNITKSDIILVDDIITTGTTLKEASKVLKQASNNTLFCLTLADASLY